VKDASQGEKLAYKSWLPKITECPLHLLKHENRQPSCKTTVNWEVAGCDVIWPETFKALHSGALSICRSCRLIRFSGSHRKIGKLGLPSPYTKRDWGVNSQTTGRSASIAFMEKCEPSALKKMPWNNWIKFKDI